jgi:hypothetical protein
LHSTRRLAAACSALLISAAGCAERASKSIDPVPESGRFTMTGRVRVVSRLSGDAPTDSLGALVLDDLGGLRVRLQRPDGHVDSTLTLNGGFEFRVDDPGLYVASCALFAAETLATSRVTVVDDHVTFPDTLTILPAGRVWTYPNPFPSAGGLAIETIVTSTQTVGVRVLNVSGSPVRTDSIAGFPPGYFHFHWVGDDDAHRALPNGMYWVALRLDGTHHVDLVIKE